MVEIGKVFSKEEIRERVKNAEPVYEAKKAIEQEFEHLVEGLFGIDLTNDPVSVLIEEPVYYLETEATPGVRTSIDHAKKVLQNLGKPVKTRAIVYPLGSDGLVVYLDTELVMDVEIVGSELTFAPEVHVKSLKAHPAKEVLHLMRFSEGVFWNNITDTPVVITDHPQGDDGVLDDIITNGMSEFIAIPQYGDMVGYFRDNLIRLEIIGSEDYPFVLINGVEFIEEIPLDYAQIVFTRDQLPPEFPEQLAVNMIKDAESMEGAAGPGSEYSWIQGELEDRVGKDINFEEDEVVHNGKRIQNIDELGALIYSNAKQLKPTLLSVNGQKFRIAMGLIMDGNKYRFDLVF